MIRLIEDLNGLVSSATDDAVSAIAEYVSAYEKILKAIAEGHDLILYVRNATVMQWFTQMSGRYPKGSFMIECIDARCRLEEKVPNPLSSNAPSLFVRTVSRLISTGRLYFIEVFDLGQA